MPKYGTQITPSYIPENSLGVPTSSTTPLRFPGIVTDAKTNSKWNTKQYRGFQTSGATDTRSYSLVTPSKNEYDFTLSYIPVKRLTAPKYDFRHFLGFALNATSSTAAGGAWTYGTACTIAIGSFTLYKQTSTINEQVNGCIASKVTVKSSLDNPVEIDVEGMATLASYASLNRTAASSLTDGVPFMWSDCRVYIDGSLATNCTAFEFSVDNHGETQHTLGNRDPQQVYPKGREVSLKVTQFFNDTGGYAASKAGTAKAVTITMTDSALGGTDFFYFRGAIENDYPNPADLENLLTHDRTFSVKTFSIG